MPESDSPLNGLRHMDTLTTEPDPALGCSLQLEAIKTSQESVEKIADELSSWIQKRLLFPDPGFHHLGTTIENLCNNVWILLNQKKVSEAKYELYMTDLPGKIKELERILEIMLQRTHDMPQEEASLKKSKLESWFNENNNSLNDEVKVLQSDTLALDKEIDMVLFKMVSHIRAGDEHSQDPDDALMTEVEKILGPTDHDVPPPELLTAKTLILGEQSLESGDGGKLLPDNQEGDSQVMQHLDDSMGVPNQPSEAGLNSNEKTPLVTRLIVPPGCDVPIKQTMVDIFSKSRQGPPETQDVSERNASGMTGADGEQLDSTNGTGTMQAPSCEETACKYIEQLPDGATKRALQSLAEASLAKVGNTVLWD